MSNSQQRIFLHKVIMWLYSFPVLYSRIRLCQTSQCSASFVHLKRTHLILPSMHPVHNTLLLIWTQESTEWDRGWHGNRSVVSPHSPQLKIPSTPSPSPYTTLLPPYRGIPNTHINNTLPNTFPLYRQIHYTIHITIIHIMCKHC